MSHDTRSAPHNAPALAPPEYSTPGKPERRGGKTEKTGVHPADPATLRCSNPSTREANRSNERIAVTAVPPAKARAAVTEQGVDSHTGRRAVSCTPGLCSTRTWIWRCISQPTTTTSGLLLEHIQTHSRLSPHNSLPFLGRYIRRDRSSTLGLNARQACC
jgi:hypothetical protein